MSLEVLDLAFVLLRGRSALERAEVASSAGAGIQLS